jgi:hypothetical protein
MNQPSDTIPSEVADALQAIFKQAAVLRADGLCAEAAEAYKSALEILPRMPRLLLEAANSLWESGNPQSARQLWTESHQIASDWTEAAYFFYVSQSSSLPSGRRPPPVFNMRETAPSEIVSGVREFGFAQIRNVFDTQTINEFRNRTRTNLASVEQEISHLPLINLSILPLMKDRDRMRELIQRNPKALLDRSILKDVQFTDIEAIFDEFGITALVSEYFGKPVVPSWQNATIRNFESHSSAGEHALPDGHSSTFHQDSRLGKFTDPALVLWTPLQTIDEVSARLSIVPQKFEHFFPTIPNTTDPERTYKCDPALIPPGSTWTPLLEIGDVLLFTSYTVHGSYYPPSGSGPRLSFDTRFIDWQE